MKRFKVIETVQATLTKVYYVNAKDDQEAVIKYLDANGDEIDTIINEGDSEGFEVEEV
jgi:hypothetical protein